MKKLLFINLLFAVQLLTVQVLSASSGEVTETHNSSFANLVDGCTDACATNYNPDATDDDGSCILSIGCIDPAACNYDATVLCDDAALCDFSCYGCTQSVALNYNPTATLDDGSCTFIPECGGAIFDSGGYNSNYTNNLNDTTIICPDVIDEFLVLVFTEFTVENGGSSVCWDDVQIWEDTNGDSAIDPTVDSQFGGSVLIDNVTGGFCGNAPADLPNGGVFAASAAGNCFILVHQTDASIGKLGYIAEVFCTTPDQIGCTQMTATNYNPNVTVEDGSCIFIPECGSATFDNGGYTGSYATNSNDTTVICPYAIDLFVTLTFTEFMVEEVTTGTDLSVCWDDVQIWEVTDGDSAIDPTVDSQFGGGAFMDTLTGGFCGNSVADLPNGGIIIPANAGNCLMLIFQSDGFVNETGYSADIVCATADQIGCTDLCSGNYNPDAIIDDGSCTAISLGCTDPSACNYDETALCDDESCDFSCYGCTEPVAVNYDPTATLDDRSCIYVAECNSNAYDNGGPNLTYTNNANDTTVICPDVIDHFVVLSFLDFMVEEVTFGTNSTICWDDVQIWEDTNGDSTIDPAVDSQFGGGVFMDNVTGGFCGNSVADLPNGGTFIPADAGSCLILVFQSDASIQQDGYTADVFCTTADQIGCTQPTATNYDPVAMIDDGSCTFVGGCTDLLAVNYDSNATLDDGSCIFANECGSAIFDNGGYTSNYTSNVNDTTVICPDAIDQFIQLTFTEFIVEDGGTSVCWDDLQIWEDTDGDSTIDSGVDSQFGGSALIDTLTGGFCGNTVADLPNNGIFITNTAGNCLVLVLQSDNSIQQTGYRADIVCANANQIGCTELCSGNYNPSAIIDDGSCTAESFGCTDATACNYDATAQCDDASCDFSCYGCTEPVADNYEPAATLDDGSCVYIAECGGNAYDNGGPNGTYTSNSNDTTIICPDAVNQVMTLIFVEFMVEDGTASGCWDNLQIWEDADGDATIDPAVDSQFGGGAIVDNVTGGFCGNSVADLPNGGIFVTSAAGNCFIMVLQSDGIIEEAGYTAEVLCTAVNQVGCLNVCSANYNPTAMIDDGSCTPELFGCTDPGACNYDASALCDDGSCDNTSCFGCTIECSANYNPSATIDDGSCTAELFGCTDPSACNYDASALCDDGSCDSLSCSGCTNTCSPNYDPSATIDDGTCSLPLFGCTDPGACNYDASALCEDGSCETDCLTDCNGVSGGTAFIDTCGDCVGGNTNLTSCNEPFSFTATNTFGQFLGQAQIEGIPAESIDYIAAIDENGVVAGAAQVTVFGGIAYIALQIYGDDPNTAVDEGLDANEYFTLQIYDQSTNTYIDYMENGQIVEFTGWANTNGAPLINYSDINMVYNFATTSVCTQLIKLNPGWNLISLDLEPADASIAAVFSSLQSGNLEFVTGFDNGALVYDSSLPFFLNTLGQLEAGFGYWVRVTNTDELTVSGNCLGNTYRKDFDAGWNLIAYPPDTPQSPSVYLGDQIAINNLEFVTGFNSGAVTFNPNLPSFLNTLSEMKNGAGYWVKLTNAVANKTKGENNASNVFDFINGTSNLLEGEVVSVQTKNGVALTELAVIEDSYLMTTPLYGDDPATEIIEGLAVGTPLVFVWNNQVIDLGVSFAGSMNVVQIHLQFDRPIAQSAVQDFQASVYPNPAYNNIVVAYHLKNNSDVQLFIFDQNGKNILMREFAEVQSGKQIINLDISELAKGAYYYKIHADKHTASGSFTKIE